MASFDLNSSKVSSPLSAALQRQSQKRFPPVASLLPVSDVRSRNGLNLKAAHSQSRNRSQFGVFKPFAQLNEGAGDELQDPTPSLEAALNLKSENQESVPPTPSVSEFISQVTDLVKLVDSKDIVELQLKQLDCEVIIRKKEALPVPSVPAPVFTQAIPPPEQTQVSSLVAPPPPPPAPVASAPRPPAAPAKPKSSSPPFKCPMAGNFFRSPAPGAPPFVKVGDKVQKGQVICIIEAMKLMNEIEADQSGTIVEIHAEDGKPVSVDMPLFTIEP
ncbi:hypothetical protein M569_10835 [Genlisea aurea]|uniref:Biotin carboxyl carrier protein of acetyl-CoA carboxylase n=1 Tax=Genlisea aurea TaxID=192259 RepID=S8CHB3_9LAMI|nr:hypothetical protein M569_10835 [Genlisea aurea]